MRAVIPTADFTGYPDGKRTEFASGVSIRVPADYADILTAKGLIEKPRYKKPEITPDNE